jgi:hypothetical protein
MTELENVQPINLFQPELHILRKKSMCSDEYNWAESPVCFRGFVQQMRGHGGPLIFGGSQGDLFAGFVCQSPVVFHQRFGFMLSSRL